MEKLHSSLSHFEFSFILADRDGEIEWVNKGFEQIHECSYEKFRAKNVNNIFALYSSEEFKLEFNKCIINQEPCTLVANINTANFTVKKISLFLVPWFNKIGFYNHIALIETDIPFYGLKEDELLMRLKQMEVIYGDLEKVNTLLEKQKEEINKQKQTIELEQQKSEKLLLNILPFEVAKQLKSKGKAGTRQYKLVSVAFADFKGFSRLSKNLEPRKLVSILDSYFARFDEIIESHYLEKIKTIGDAYMFAGGLPLSNKSNPVDSVLAGLEIQQYMNALNDNRVVNNEDVCELRIGIHTGPVIAGVVGRKRLAYDIWGDTVNIASRMEQSGHVGMVNISGITYEYIKDFFDCDYRGRIEIKNLEKTDMYFVNRIKPEYSADKFGFIPNDKMTGILNKL